MLIEESTYLVKMWFVGWGDGDFLMTLFKKNAADRRLHFEFRTRIYGEPAFPGLNDPFTDDDRKSAPTTGSFEAPEDEAIRRLDDLAQGVVNFARHIRRVEPMVDHILIQGGADRFVSLAKEKSWCHLRRVE